MHRLCAVALTIVAASANQHPWMDRSQPPRERALKLLAAMNLSEKIVMLHGPSSGPCCECWNTTTGALSLPLRHLPALWGLDSVRSFSFPNRPDDIRHQVKTSARCVRYRRTTTLHL